MASWHDRLWPLRRWLADRLIGDHAYSKNLAYPAAATFVADLLSGVPYATTSSSYPDTRRPPLVFDFTRDPGETS